MANIINNRGILADTDSFGNPIDTNFEGTPLPLMSEAQRISQRMNRDAGFSTDDLTSMVSNDDNDLDQVQFTTTDGAKVNIQNQRGKTAEGASVVPTVKTLGALSPQSPTGPNNVPQTTNNVPQSVPQTINNVPQQAPQAAQPAYEINTPGGNLEITLPAAVTDFTGETKPVPADIPVNGVDYNTNPTAPLSQKALEDQGLTAESIPTQGTSYDQRLQDELLQANRDQVVPSGVPQAVPQETPSGSVYSDGSVDQDFLDSQNPDVYTGNIAEPRLEPQLEPQLESPVEAPVEQEIDPAYEAQEASDDLAVATINDPQSMSIVNSAKGQIENLKSSVEEGLISVEDAQNTISNTASQIGELLGVNKQDLMRGLLRYAGARVFGSSNSEAARFAYRSFTQDNAVAPQGPVKSFGSTFKHSDTGKLYSKRITQDGRPEYVGVDGEVLGAEASSRLRETSKEKDLSAATQKTVDVLQDNVMQADKSTRNANAIINGFDKHGDDMFSGVLSSVAEGYKNVTGTEDEITQLRKAWREMTVNLGINSLPPGVASDKDIQLAFSAVPKEGANPEFIKAWTRARMAVSNYDKAYNQFQINYIEDNYGKRSGLDKAWESSEQYDNLTNAIKDPLRGWGTGDKSVERTERANSQKLVTSQIGNTPQGIESNLWDQY